MIEKYISKIMGGKTKYCKRIGEVCMSEQVEYFPDGTQVDQWFFDTKVPALEEPWNTLFVNKVWNYG